MGSRSLQSSPSGPPPGDRLDLREALAVLRAHADTSQGHRVGIACSFTPLHLATFVSAYIASKRPDVKVSPVSGIYGDLPGTIDHLIEAGVDSCVAVVEWSDLDPRLGCRDAVGAPIGGLGDITTTSRRRLERIGSRLEVLGKHCQTALALPSLELPAVYAGSPVRFGRLPARLNLLLADFAARMVDAPGVRIVAPEALLSNGAEVSAPRDLRSDIRSGFPYSVSHASTLAKACAEVLLPAPAKKGLITDLDDTLWRGLVGEIGPDAVSWDLDSGSHTHALYQQLIAGLSRRGVLIAIASKNDPEIVQKVLARADLHISPEEIYPVAVSWGPKSLAVDQILRAWNIAASDVVFVDDSPMELAEVAATHPDVTTVLFPVTDPNAVAATLTQLAGLFWREQVNAEDHLRLSSVRSAAEVEETRRRARDEPSFLRDLAGRITIRAGRSWQEPRALELVNKTNQFNLNGRRFDEAQWRQLCTGPGAIVWVVSYEDRFGPLGVISVLAGSRAERTLTIDCWVMSCRAFSRAIEHHLLRKLCGDGDQVVLDFIPTERNSVLRGFLERAARVDNRDTKVFDGAALRDDEIADVHSVHYDFAN